MGLFRNDALGQAHVAWGSRSKKSQLRVAEQFADTAMCRLALRADSTADCKRKHMGKASSLGFQVAPLSFLFSEEKEKNNSFTVVTWVSISG